MNTPFGASLQAKIQELKSRRQALRLGGVPFASNLLLAPMASIGNAPFRLLMEELGAGGTVSELISCHGINHGNSKTLNMLRIDPRERHVGLQLFGESPQEMARAVPLAEAHGPSFIDINMGCPVKKVVQKGAGAALLKEPEKLIPYFRALMDVMELPLSVKVRTGWDQEGINALEVCQIAADCGLAFIAIHGRTRAQAYRGQADWSYLEEVAHQAPLPVIGNGDLHTPEQVRQRRAHTSCQALMLARGPLRNPFLFLQAEDPLGEFTFTPLDTLEVIDYLRQLIEAWFPTPRVQEIQLKKHIVWFAQGFPHTAKFRGRIFETSSMTEIRRLYEDYFQSLGATLQTIDLTQNFMMSGHG